MANNNARIKSYHDCHKLAQTRRRKIANNTYLDTNSGPERYYIILHSTRIITYYQDGRISLNTGGWWTVTTKQRINEFSPIRVGSDRSVRLAWNNYADDSTTHLFADGITFHPDGTVTHRGKPCGEEEQRQVINWYSKVYLSDADFGKQGNALKTYILYHIDSFYNVLTAQLQIDKVLRAYTKKCLGHNIERRAA